ncbi:hypothetical protein VTI28DRAFT_10453 [Corynascus sepedonium]
MAPSKSNRERRRGRPPGFSAASRHEPGDVSVRNQASMNTAMEPETTRKKRGRPRKSIAPEAEDEEHTAAEQVPQTESPPTVPKRRTRAPKTRNPEPEEETSPEERPRKRRRAREGDEAEDEQSGDERNESHNLKKASNHAPEEAAHSEDRDTQEPTNRRSTRARQSGRSSGQQPEQEPETESRQSQKGKGRRGRKPANHEEQSENQSREVTSNRKSRRERLSANNKRGEPGEQPPSTASGSGTQEQIPRKRKRGRPSLAELSISRAQNQPSPPRTEQRNEKRRGSSRSSGEDESPSQAAGPSPSVGRPEKHAAGRLPPSRRTPSSSDEPSRRPRGHVDMLVKHRHLTALTRHIPRATIASKWTPLSPPSIAAVTSLLADSARPVLHRLRDRDQRHAQAALILRTFSARLHSKLVKGMPFPPPTVPSSKAAKKKAALATEGGDSARQGGGGGGHEVELDFERTVDAIAGLERALDPLLHSVALLRAEKEREERALEREYEALRRLEGNARAQARGWREGRGRGREHILMRGLLLGTSTGEVEGDGGERDGSRTGRSLEVVPPATKRGGGGSSGIFKDLQEEELLALSQQLGNHMESMRSNLGQIEGVLPAIARARAALQGTLCEQLDPEQYEQVLLG